MLDLGGGLAQRRAVVARDFAGSTLHGRDQGLELCGELLACAAQGAHRRGHGLEQAVNRSAGALLQPAENAIRTTAQDRFQARCELMHQSPATDSLKSVMSFQADFRNPVA